MTGVRFLRAALVGASALFLLSCTDRAPLGLEASLDQPGDSHFGWWRRIGLVTCTPLPYDSVTQTIGPDGGTIVVGGNTLAIPAGALDTAVTITAVAPSDTLRHVRFQPEGLTFQEPASLTLSYAGCNVWGWLRPKRIAFTTDAFEILEYLLSVDDLWSQTVTGQVHHFSEYAIAW